MVELFFVFAYVGLFTIGGGMVAIPLILQQVVSRGWISEVDFYSMVAIAQSTPGPVGINVATYVGYEMYGVFGSVVATIGFILPSFIIISFLAGLLRKYRTKPLVINWFIYVKAAIVGLILYTLYQMTKQILVPSGATLLGEWKSLVFLGGISIVFYFFQKRPWIVIILGGVLGAIFL